MSSTTYLAANQKRTTSSAGYRFPDQPATDQERTRLIQGDLMLKERHRVWRTEIVKVQRCTSTEYNNGFVIPFARCYWVALIDGCSWETSPIFQGIENADHGTYRDGYQTLFEYSAAEPEKTALLQAEGDIRKLTLSVQVNAVRQDPSPAILNKFEITEDTNLYTIRLFDYKWSMDIHVDPRKVGRGHAKLPGDYWAIHLRVHNGEAIKAAKRMLRRVESVALEMPDKWFKYRNFFTKPSASASVPDTSETPHSSQGSATEGAFEKELPGGYKVRWTGALATPMFLRAMGHQNIRPPRQPSPETVIGDSPEHGEPAQVGRVTRAKANE